MTRFPHLFSPLRVGGMTVKNRIFSAPMGAGSLSAEGYLQAETVDFYELLARGGAGLVCIGESLVHSATGNNHGRVIRLDDPGTVPGLIRCTDAIHAQGALASIELVHPGRRADPIYNKEGKTYGPSGGMCHYGEGEHEVTELTEEMIQVIVNAFGDAAEMAMIAGCDMVTVHGGHGWLLNQFFSPANNERTDRFGGSVENRARIFLMVAENIRAKCGPDFPIDFRLSGDDLMEDGATLEDTVKLAEMLAPKIDLLHISAASFHNRKASIRMFPSMFYPRGVNAYLAQEIKKHVKIPVVTVGGFAEPQQMEDMLREGKVDAFAMGRALLADPFWPDKALTGQEDDIIYCVRCNNCLSSNFVPYVKYPMGVSHCPVNPWHYLTTEFMHRRIPYGDMRVLVVGGGPAGMEAALGAAECGHDVILCEASDSLGGMLKDAWHPPFKKDLRRFVEVLSRRIHDKENIELRLNTVVDEKMVSHIAPDAVIVAIGGKPAVPPIPGIDDPRVVSFTDLHKPGAAIGDNVLVIGGGLTGCEEGLALAQSGKSVRIVEMTDRLASTATYIHYISLLEAMDKEPNLVVETETLCESIGEDGVHCKKASGEHVVYPADTVVIAAGVKPQKDAAEAFRKSAPYVAVVGDCHRSDALPEAVRQGYFAGYNLQRRD